MLQLRCLGDRTRAFASCFVSFVVHRSSRCTSHLVLCRRGRSLQNRIRKGTWARRTPLCMMLRQVLSHYVLSGTHCHFGWLLQVCHPKPAYLPHCCTPRLHHGLPHDHCSLRLHQYYCLLQSPCGLLTVILLVPDACQPGLTSGFALQTKQWYDPSQGPPKATTIGPPPKSSLATASAKGYTLHSLLAIETYAVLPFHMLLFAFQALSGKCPSVT